jgi:hypothetical protein
VGRQLKALVVTCALLALAITMGVGIAAATAPTVSIEAPSSVSYTSAHVAGKVNPEDQETSYYFQYSTEPENEFSWASGPTQGPLAANSGQTAAADDLTNLQPSTQYSVRLVAENVDGQAISPAPYPTFTTDAVGPPTVSIDAPSSVTPSGAHFSGTINPNAPAGNPAAFDVSWRFECSPECPGVHNGTVPADSAPHTVETDLTDLQPNTSYEVTLVARNAGGPTTAGPLTFDTAEQAPDVFAAPVANVTQSGATLTGLVNPSNSAVSDCHFEYGATAAYGQTIPCEQTPSGTSTSLVTAELTGLSPVTTLHFRLLVTTTGGSAEGDDRTFTTLAPIVPDGSCPNAAIRAQQEAQMLPECRAFEQVSPVDKNGANVSIAKAGQSADVAGRVAYSSSTAFPGGDTALAIGFYRSVRGPGGWTTRSVDLPQKNSGVSIVQTTRLISADLDKSVSASNLALTPDADPEGANVYVNDLNGGPPALMAMEGLPGGRLYNEFMDVFKGPVFGATHDFDRLVFDSAVDFGDGATTGVGNVWEWHEGQLSLVNRLPDGSPSPYGGRTGTMLHSPERGQQFISEDGSRIYFAVPILSPGNPVIAIYVREGGVTTKLVSRSHRAGDDPTNPVEANFNGMSADGRYAFISSQHGLTSDAPEGGQTKLYRYDLEQDSLELIAENGIEGDSASEITTRQVSDDGERIYFVSQGKVTPDAPLGSAPKLYLWDRGDLRHVAELGQQDFAAPFGMSDDGRYAAFSSEDSPTGFDSTSPACPGPGGEPAPCNEVYLYDAVAEAVSCLSCTPSGASAGEATLGVGAKGGIYQPRAVLSSGTVMFDTPTALVPEDTNRKRDVYAARDGKVRLLSSGVNRNDAFYLDTSLDGTDAYFGTVGRLVAQDSDTLRDIYTARIEGGIPAQNVVAPKAPDCQGESCQGVPPLQTTPGAIGSEGIKGNGNAGPRARGVISVKGRVSVTGLSTRLAVKVRSAGTLRASGPSIRPVRRSIAKPKTVSVPIALTAEGKRELGERGVMSVKVRFTFQMRSGEKIVRKARVTFKKPGTSRKAGG